MSLLTQLSSDLQALVERAAPAVVGVEHRRGHGTGLLLAPDGYVLTNHHVVRGGRSLRVRLHTGEERSAELVGKDPLTDLAVVRAAGSGFSTLPLAPRERVHVGQLVVAMGNPFHLERSVSLGVVSALHRSLPTPDGSMLEGLLQTDAAINPGNSGGPLLSADAEVVGINSVVLPYAQGIGFAIPASTAQWVAALLIQRGSVERRYLGVAARAEGFSGASALAAGQPRGVHLLKIADEGPAARAGLRTGDWVLEVDGRPVGSVDDLHRHMALAASPSIRLAILRDSQRSEVEVRTTQRPEAQAA